MAHNKKPDTEGCPAFFIEPSGSLLPAWFYEKRRSAAPAACGFCLGTRAPFWFFCRKAKNPVEACFQLGAVKKAVMQRSCKRLSFGYKGPVLVLLPKGKK